ncbi:MAG: 6-carboxytetrahydropterin synthase QueD [Solirubrobacteraceae bacterium]
MELACSFTFEAAHRLPNAPEGHKCRRLHGHSFKVTLLVRGEPQQPAGWVMDYADIAVAWASVHERLDHRYLNEIEGLENPTSELLAEWVFKALTDTLPALCAVQIAETCTCRCSYGPGPTGQDTAA